MRPDYDLGTAVGDGDGDEGPRVDGACDSGTCIYPEKLGMRVGVNDYCDSIQMEKNALKRMSRILCL